MNQKAPYQPAIHILAARRVQLHPAADLDGPRLALVRRF